MGVKVTERSALVEVVASSQQFMAHAGLVFVRELAARVGVGELLDRRVTVKERRRGYRPSQAILGLCETLIAGGECLETLRCCAAIRRRSFCVVTGCRSRRRRAGSCAASVSVISASSTGHSTRCSRVCIRCLNGRR